jgi:hypothetical protein
MHDVVISIMATPASRRRGIGLIVALHIAAVLGVTGCQTPDLHPFAATTATVAASIAQGGDLAIEAAIADVSANRKANATALQWLRDAVKQGNLALVGEKAEALLAVLGTLNSTMKVG